MPSRASFETLGRVDNDCIEQTKPTNGRDEGAVQCLDSGPELLTHHRCPFREFLVNEHLQSSHCNGATQRVPKNSKFPFQIEGCP